jgi:hypothetical protein
MPADLLSFLRMIYFFFAFILPTVSAFAWVLKLEVNPAILMDSNAHCKQLYKDLYMDTYMRLLKHLLFI